MTVLYILNESAAGYLLTSVAEWDKVAEETNSVQTLLQNAQSFAKICQFVAFLPFKNAAEALENMQGIANSSPTPLLINFLNTHLPQPPSKPSKIIPYNLCVSDVQLAKALSKEGILIDLNYTSYELLRASKEHMQKIAKGISKIDMGKFQVGLGHSFSRTKIQFDPNRQDKPIMQAIALIDSLDKNINKFAMRVREWYGWHFPELGKIVTDNKIYCQLVQFIKMRESYTPDKFDELVTIAKDEEIAHSIVNAMKVTMGQEIVEYDLDNIEKFSQQVFDLSSQRETLGKYLESKLKVVAPNLQSLLGDILTARLISHAGSLVSLAKYPASTIQILGAEKALFRALKAKTNTPKYGLLFQSQYIGMATAKNKGKIARYLANKCSMAARIDNFTTELQSDIFGVHLRDQVLERLKFLTDKVLPQKNIDVMGLAVKEYQQLVNSLQPLSEESKKIKKKKKKAKLTAPETNGEQNSLLIDSVETIDDSTVPKKRKITNAQDQVTEIDTPIEKLVNPKKKKKSKKIE